MKGKKRDYYSPQEVEEKTGVKVDTIYRLCRAGRIPGAKKLGGSWLIPKDFGTAPQPEA